MADSSFQIGGVVIGLTADGQGGYTINRAARLGRDLRYFEWGGTRIPCVEIGDGTCSLLIGS